VLPGLGAIIMRYGQGADSLAIVVMHLALSRRGQNQQLDYVNERLKGFKHVILMGDLNTHAEHLLKDSPLTGLELQPVSSGLKTFPSWRPKLGLDHILVSRGIKVKQVGVLDIPVSDHLPIAMEVEIPIPISQV